MESSEREKELEKLFGDSGFLLTAEQLSQFLLYYELLIEKNKVMNLTAITEFPEVLTKHFLDSVMLLRFLPEPEKLIDVGTGAGFPGIPLKIVSPGTEVLLLDSLKKRIMFLHEAVEELKLSGITALHARAEEAAEAPKKGRTADGNNPGRTMPILREQFDTVVSRAVAALPVLLEYCLPFVKPGGYFVSYKSGNPEEEIRSSERALRILGGEIEKTEKFSLPGNAGDRSLIFVKKVRETPARYPRKSGTPGKEPL